MKYSQFIILFGLTFFLWGQSFSQENIVNVQQFRVKEGLAHRHVYSVFKDKSSFLWLGLPNELQRFDGYEFKSFPLPEYLENANHIYQGADDWLRIVNSNDKQLLFMHPQSGAVVAPSEKWGEVLSAHFEAIKSTAHHIAWEEDHIYCLTPDGVMAIDWQTGESTELISSRLWEGKKVSKINLIDDRQNIWLRTETELVTINTQQNTLDAFNSTAIVPDGELLRLFDWQGKAWAVLQIEQQGNWLSQLVQLELNGDRETAFTAPPGYFIHQFLDGLIWCVGASSWKIYDFSGKLRFELFPEDYDKRLFTTGANHHLVKLGANKYYLPSPFGLTIIETRKNAFTQYSTQSREQHLPVENSARNIIVRNDSIFVVFEFNGVFVFPKGQAADHHLLVSHKRHPISKQTGGFDGRTIYQDANRQIWGDMGGALYCWSSDFSSVKSIPFTDQSPFHHQAVWSIFADQHQDIWLAHSTTLRKITSDQSSSEAFDYLDANFGYQYLDVYQIHEPQEGFLWLCTSKGLFVFDKEKKKVREHYHDGGQGKYHIPASDLFFMHLDSQGNRWLGTRSGLIFWDRQSDEKRLFTRKDGLSNTVIYAVYEDEFNKLWLSSDYGIMSFDKQTYEVQTYLPKDGVTQEEFNRISHFQDEEGMIYFGGLDGVTTFHPRDFARKEKEEAKLMLSDFEIFDGESEKLINRYAEVFANQTIVFKPNDRFFRLKFSLPNFEEVQSILYAWKIEGMDTDWNYQKENSIQIGILPYGTHTMSIKGQNGKGWSPHELTLKIKVLKPFYLQSGFILSTILMLTAGIYCFFRRRTQKLKASKVLLQTEIQKATAQIKADKKVIEQQAETLRQLDKMKSRFFTNVTHELRTPLTLILAPIRSVIQSGELSNYNFTLLKKAQMGGMDLMKLVQSILGLAKMEAGKMELNEQTESLYPLIRRIVADFESHAQREGIQFIFQYHPEKDLQLLLDAEKIKIILHNLLSNAIKFTLKGGQVSIEIWDEANHVKMMVRDTGRGIPSHDLPNIFNRFYQSTLPDAPSEGGTGIGLALTQELVQLMHGRIWVKSEFGRGSTFYVKIPRKEVLGASDPESAKIKIDSLGETAIQDYPMPLALPVSPKSTMASQATESILVVEDNHALKSYLKTILSPSYRVLTAENGQAALDLLQLTSSSPKSAQAIARPSAIISDIMMPVMDGYQLLKALKAADEFRFIPVIILTARADTQDKLEALRIGVDDYVLKPFVEEELLVRIDNLVHNYRERVRQFATKAGESNPTTSEVITISKEDQDWLSALEKQLQSQLDNSKYSIAQLADDLAISERQLRRRIKQLIGITPAQYLKAVRLKKARQLLEQKTFKTVAQTATAVGFQDVKVFSRNFYQQFGRYPSEYLNY
ncbi:MAG: ATP-binding protein [Bacteroidota bacterium]